MYKKVLFFVSLGALLLTSCSFSEAGGKSSSAKKINEEKAGEMLTEIQTKLEENGPQPYSVEITTKTSAGIQSEERVYTYKDNLDGDIYCSWKFKSAGKVTSSGFAMQKNHSTYEQVSYYEATEGTETYKGALAKKDNPSYEEQVEYFMEEYMEGYSSIVEMIPALTTGENYTVEKIQEAAESYVSSGYGVNATYSSEGKGSLIIKVITAPLEGTTAEYLLRSDETITFKHYRFSELKSVNKYVSGASLTINAKMKYGQNTIELPSGWEQSLYTPSED